MAAKTPWMPLYVNDWFGSMTRALMSPTQRAGYLELLMHQWGSEDGALPADDDMLGMLSGLGAEWEENKEVILKRFPPHPTIDGRIANPRCLELIGERQKLSKTRSEAGKKGAAATHGRDGDVANANRELSNASDSEQVAQSLPDFCHKQNLGSQSQSQSQSQTSASEAVSEAKAQDADAKPCRPTADGAAKSKPTKHTYPKTFEAWWSAYPKERRVGKKQTHDAWVTATKRLREANEWSTEQAQALLQSQVEAYAASPAAQRTKYVPHPHRWLSQGRYDDNPSAWENHNETGRRNDAQSGRATF